MGRSMMSYALHEKELERAEEERKATIVMDSHAEDMVPVEKWGASNAFDPDSEAFWNDVVYEAFLEDEDDDDDGRTVAEEEAERERERLLPYPPMRIPLTNIRAEPNMPNAPRMMPRRQMAHDEFEVPREVSPISLGISRERFRVAANAVNTAAFMEDDETMTADRIRFYHAAAAMTPSTDLSHFPVSASRRVISSSDHISTPVHQDVDETVDIGINIERSSTPPNPTPHRDDMITDVGYLSVSPQPITMVLPPISSPSIQMPATPSPAPATPNIHSLSPPVSTTPRLFTWNPSAYAPVSPSPNVPTHRTPVRARSHNHNHTPHHRRRESLPASISTIG